MMITQMHSATPHLRGMGTALARRTLESMVSTFAQPKVRCAPGVDVANSMSSALRRPKGMGGSWSCRPFHPLAKGRDQCYVTRGPAFTVELGGWTATTIEPGVADRHAV